jgi:heme-degrading monooxygenase HmoA
MYIARREVRVVGGKAREFLAFNEALHAGMKVMPGFRWGMLLRSMGYPGKMATIDMWQTRQQAQDWSDSEAQLAAFTAHPIQGIVAPIGMAHGYDVVTARGSMTPAPVAAIVEWEVDSEHAKAFVDRWNAAYHQIEDRIGSRLGRHLSDPTAFTGIHVAQSEAALAQDVLGSELRLAENLAVRPASVDRYDVVMLTEA